MHVFHVYHFFLVTLNLIPIPFPTYVFEFKGGHLMKVNWLVQTMVGIDQKVYKAIKHSKSCRPHTLKNRQKIITKEKIMMEP
jgi:hypothetical protein